MVLAHGCSRSGFFPVTVFSLLLTSLSVVLIWVVTNEIVAVVIVSCVFTASTGMVTGALDFVVINLYDTDSR